MLILKMLIKLRFESAQAAQQINILKRIGKY